MIVWGGADGTNPNFTYPSAGGRYNPSGDFWLPSSTGANTPSGRAGPMAVNTGSQMIVWGGSAGANLLFTNSGGVYCHACTPTTWYQDGDSDGYGTSAATVSSCGQPPGYAALSGDCNDANPAINPGATEVCDGADNDCDGTIDTDTAPPAGIPALLVEKPSASTARLSWATVAFASVYDVVAGNLAILGANGGDFIVATTGCLQNDTAATMYDDGGPIPFPDGRWYLIRAGNCGGGGTYDSGAPSQVGLRDVEIATSGNDCP
jgi:hypothetical protein